jgi:hypothetical protein
VDSSIIAAAFVMSTNWSMAAIVPQHAEFVLNRPKKKQRQRILGQCLSDGQYLQRNHTRTRLLYPKGNRAVEKNTVIRTSARKKSAYFTYQEVVSEGDLGEHRVRLLQRYFVKGKRAYTLTYSAQFESFDELKRIVSEMFDSFRLK